MDLEVEALLFNKPTSHDRKHFRATLFVEKSIKLDREIRVYGLLVHQVWVELDADSHVVDYNEAPLAVPIPMGDTIFKQKFKFAVRRDDGLVQVISVHDEAHSSADENEDKKKLQERLSKEAAIHAWAKKQDIEYRSETKTSVAARSISIANLRRMRRLPGFQ